MGFIRNFFSDDEGSDLKEASKTYEVSKQELLNKLGFGDKKISFIQYDWRRNVLIIKEGNYKK